MIFVPFYTTHAEGGGTGPGLGVCQRIIQEFGGRIEVESTVGQGTTFKVHLPAHDGQKTATAEPAARPSVARARVLLVDDEELVLRTLERMLGRDHDVTACSTAKNALAKLTDDEQYDICFVDLMMPGMSGIAFHAAVAARFGALAEKIVFLTGGAFTPEARDFIENCDNLMLQKPIGYQKLQDLIAQRLPRTSTPDEVVARLRAPERSDQK